MDTKNVVVLVGRLTADPELRFLPNGTPVTNFSIAVNRSTRKPDGSFDDSLDGFFDCELFGGQALALAQGSAKGSELHLTGSLRQKKFQAQGSSRTISKVEIRVSSVAPVLAVPKDAQSAPVQQEVPAPQPA